MFGEHLKAVQRPWGCEPGTLEHRVESVTKAGACFATVGRGWVGAARENRALPQDLLSPIKEFMVILRTKDRC